MLLFFEESRKEDYGSPASIGDRTAVRIPATAMDRPLTAPSVSPISRALLDSSVPASSSAVPDAKSKKMPVQRFRLIWILVSDACGWTKAI